MGLQIGSGDQTRASHFVEEKKKEEGCGGREGLDEEEERWEACVYVAVAALGVWMCVWGWAAVLGVNNSDDFPNLAWSRMWMAALERNCDGFIWLPVCFFSGRREEDWQDRKRRGRKGRRAGAWWRSAPRRKSKEVQSK